MLGYHKWVKLDFLGKTEYDNGREHEKYGKKSGADGSRTRDLHNAIVTCSQLHHSPICGFLV